ncbi:MAG: hypothetical protein QNK31_13020 [Porticoccus sp.]|nr:hypothetical protein [Porticoccus sp.]
MQSWFKVKLGDAMLANESLLHLKANLSNVYEVKGRAERMLAIYRHESEELHCNLVVYLTTEFQDAARLENAIRCNIPPLSDSSFLAGNKMHMSEIL